VKGNAEAESALARAEALQERSGDLLRQQIIEALPEIIRAASEPLSAIKNLTILSSDGTSGTSAVGQSVAGQLATSTQIIKDLVGIDISEIVTGRAAGHAIGEALNPVDGIADAAAAAVAKSKKS